jgi:hypothetical protein
MKNTKKIYFSKIDEFLVFTFATFARFVVTSILAN